MDAEPAASSAQSREFELLQLCARTTVDSEAREKIRLHLENEIDWEFLIRKAHEHRVLPLVYRTLTDICRDLVPKSAMDRLRRGFYVNAKRNLTLTAELFQVLSAFEQHNIPAIPYKGPILAAALYGEVSLRQFSDLDVIVPKDSVEKATAVLVDRGYRWKNGEGDVAPIAGNKEKDLLLCRDDLGIDFELHWGITVETDPLQVKPEVLWENLNVVPVGGKPVKIHTPEDLMVILCIHGAKHGWEHLGWLCDVAEIIRCYPELDWDRLIHRAAMLGALRMVLMGLLLARNSLGIELPKNVESRIEADEAIVRLADQVQTWLASETGPAPGETERYYLQLRERSADKLRVAVNQFKRYLMLTSRDREAFPVHFRFSAPILYVIRPFRLLREYGLNPFWRFFKGIFESGSAKPLDRRRITIGQRKRT